MGIASTLQAFAMQANPAISPRNDGHLWAIAVAVSLLANLLLLVLAGMAAIEFREKRAQPSAEAAREEETYLTIEAVPAEEALAAPASEQKRFARTSPEQAAEPLRDPAFIGERATRATSDRAPDANAPDLLSQAGIEPRDAADIETTESDYQDGELVPENVSQAAPQSPPPPAAANPPLPPGRTMAATAPPREKLLDGPNPVDVPVPPEAAPADEIKPAPEQAAVSESPPPSPVVPEETAESPPVPQTDASPKPAFRGNQRKTAIVGSITRNGRSSLDVEDSALGRYQAAISRAVELEWQRNCVRHRDFITPGFLTVRFFVEKTGRVRSVQFVGDMETGEVQKGFTLNSIRDAAIPAMPMALGREFDEEPLELIFRFYF